MYKPSTIRKLCLALLLASISSRIGQSYASGYNTGQYRYFPNTSRQYPPSGSSTGQYPPSGSHAQSNTGQYPQTQHNTGQYSQISSLLRQYLLSLSNAGQYVPSPPNAGQYVPSPPNTGRYPPVGHNSGQTSHGQYMYHNSQNHDVTEVCNGVVCGEGRCSVVIRDDHSPPRPICSSVTGNPPIPRDANGACRPNGFTTAVLTGNPNGVLPLEPLSCFSYDDCPYGSTCINSACCFGRPNCRSTEELGDLFQASFEFNGRVYALSTNPVFNDETANAICVAQGGYLVEIESAAEDMAIANFLLNHPNNIRGFYIAGTDVDDEGNFVFQYSGRDLQYFNFAPGEPSDSMTVNCLAIGPTGPTTFGWYNIGCSLEGANFMCEFAEIQEKKKKTSYPYYH